MRFRKMVDFGGFVLRVAAYIIVAYYINLDLKRKEADMKISLVWMIASLVGLFALDIQGLLIVIVLYFLWTRHSFQ